MRIIDSKDVGKVSEYIFKYVESSTAGVSQLKVQDQVIKTFKTIMENKFFDFKGEEKGLEKLIQHIQDKELQRNIQSDIKEIIGMINSNKNKNMDNMITPKNLTKSYYEKLTKIKLEDEPNNRNIERIATHLFTKAKKVLGLSKDDIKAVNELKNKHSNLKFFKKTELEVTEVLTDLKSFEDEGISVYQGFIVENK